MASAVLHASPAAQEEASGATVRDERRLWTLTAAGACVFAVVKGMRLPGYWACTQALLNYSQGMIKRGLQGQALLLLHIHSFRALTLAFALQGLLFCLALAWLTSRSRVARRTGIPAIPAIVFGGFAITYLANMLGYSDLVLLAAGCVLLGIRDARRRLVAAVPVSLLAVLLHENFLVVLPAVLLSFVLQGGRGAQAHRRMLTGAGALALLCVAVTAALSWRPPLNAAQNAAMQAQLAGLADFPLNDGVLAVLHRSLLDNLLLTQTVRAEWRWQLEFLSSAALLLPVEMFLLFQVRRLLGRRAPLGFACGLAPLLLHGIAWDATRWNVLCVITTYMVLCTAAMHSRGELPRPSLVQRHIAVLLFAFGLASGDVLFDGTGVRFPPFTLSLQGLHDRLLHRGTHGPDGAQAAAQPHRIH